MPPTSLVKPTRISAAFSSSIRRHAFATSSAHRGSILFSLNSLSNSRETQHFNRLSKLNRVEHSPPLKLIEQSEVKPYPLPALPPDLSEEPAPEAATISDTQTSEQRASEIGRAVLAQHAKQLRNLQRRKKRQRLAFEAEREAWQAERTKYQTQMREAGALLLMSIAVATGLATWRFWPENDKKVAGTDSGVLGQEMGSEAEQAMQLSTSATETKEVAPVTTAMPASPSGASASYAPVPSASSSGGSWWKGLFWKES
ncbi:hypothetical protein KC318_g17 [Hortaea werneckii]|uniref:Uncharacterized protein n=1 Tax=Hortaea werneckii TaxID=91943 RepID=A0A3M7BRR6_HORWE|nr:hypothetical protein KC334_g16 [Hortaea werneckii]KAI7028347.1 hypothetical protein KC355_g18 [Hortaea werneckii]KAI7676781.1 hypothetical protein KC318_g17 [Hortaea werneckii]RMY26244.1 hypothetical protein D0867_00175 [Hortaea werneckii]RMY42167.1 hypothetical protein D0866_00102 [Hortaea werneckii]